MYQLNSRVDKESPHHRRLVGTPEFKQIGRYREKDPSSERKEKILW